MELIEWILKDENLRAAIKAVKGNKGAAGIDEMPVEELDGYFAEHGEEIKTQIRAKQYKPQPVRRVYIPKANGKQRPLGIPTVVDRVIQQAAAQVLSLGYERYFSEYSYGFRPGRDCHGAVAKALEYLNEGYEWVIDLDIEKYFDTPDSGKAGCPWRDTFGVLRVNHDKLVSIMRERINAAPTLHLIRSFLKAGVMEDGLTKPTTEEVPQGGPLSPVLSNVYLDKLDKELEGRGLHFVRYADDCDIFVKSEMAADRVMKSVTSWLERKLRLKVSATKTKVVRPTKSVFLGFTFWKDGNDARDVFAHARPGVTSVHAEPILYSEDDGKADDLDEDDESDYGYNDDGDEVYDEEDDYDPKYDPDDEQDDYNNSSFSMKLT